MYGSLYGSCMDPCMVPLYGSWMDRYMDPIWIPGWILYGSLYIYIELTPAITTKIPGTMVSDPPCNMVWQQGSARLYKYITGRGLSPRTAEGTLRSIRPVYGAATSREPVTPGCGGGTTAARGRSTGAPWLQPPHFRDRDWGLWSRPRPPDPLVGKALSPRAAEGTAAQGRFRGAKRDHL